MSTKKEKMTNWLRVELSLNSEEYLVDECNLDFKKLAKACAEVFRLEHELKNNFSHELWDMAAAAISEYSK